MSFMNVLSFSDVSESSQDGGLQTTLDPKLGARHTFGTTSSPPSNISIGHSISSDQDQNSVISASPLGNSGVSAITSDSSISISAPLEKLSLSRNFELQQEFLNFLEPRPVKPPKYSTLAPGGCPRFPTYCNEDDSLAADHPYRLAMSRALYIDDSPLDTAPPTYTPAVYKITAVIRKVEWLTPYDVAPNRRWKCCIMELNSTQLNFYLIPTLLEEQVIDFCAGIGREDQVSLRIADSDDEIVFRRSRMTRDSDIQFYRFCRDLDLIPRMDCRRYKSPILRQALRVFDPTFGHLLRSYSLQHATVGLAIDYMKRENVLRARLESEQILLHFCGTQELIDWEMAISVGSGVALDILERALPSFCTVPRRRRRRRGWSDMRDYHPLHPVDRVTLRQRRGSTGGNLVGSFSTQMRRFSSLFAHPSLKRALPIQAGPAARNHLLEAPSRSGHEEVAAYEARRIISDEDEEDDDHLQFPTHTSSGMDPLQVGLSDMPFVFNHAFAPTSFGWLDLGLLGFDSDDGEREVILPVVSKRNDPNQGQVDGHDSQDQLHADSTYGDVNGPDRHGEKWFPHRSRRSSKRRMHRNCLRCIRTLANYDPWVSQSVVAPTAIPPFTFEHGDASSKTSGSLQSSSVGNSLISDQGQRLLYENSLHDSGAKSKRYSMSHSLLSPLRTLSDGVTRIPCHFVREYVVGSQALIPKVV